MHCPSCQAEFPSDAQYCSECGTPAPPSRRPATALVWLGERRPIFLAAVGGFCLATIGGAALVFPQQESARASALPAPPSLERPTDPPGPLAEIPRLSVRAAAAVRPALGGPVPMAPAAAPPLGLSLPEADVPPPLPEGFEYDPRWGFEPPPRVSRRPVKKPEPFWDVTPPSHTLAMDPNRPRGSFVTLVPRRGTVQGVDEATAPAGMQLPSLRGD